MEQLVLIIPSIGVKLDMKRSIRQIVSYVGTRMVDDDLLGENVPGVLLKSTLCKKDKENLQEIVFSSNGDGVLAFITLTEEGTEGLNYIDATINSYEDED